jgi:DNA polymerase III delta prime subunit
MMPEATFSMFQSERSRVLQKGLAISDPGKPALPLTEKHRPKTFNAIVGQSGAVESLRDFATMPHPQAFIFSGYTGAGKTTAALVLRDEIGVNDAWDFIHIKSGELDAESVQDAMKQLRRCGIKDGWKLVLCDEADMMSAKAKSLWLSALESLQSGEYGKSIIVFTTNNAEKFETRFVDRCEHIKFESAAKTILPDAQELLARIWTLEGIAGPVPDVSKLPDVIDKGNLSFRRVVRAVETASRRSSHALADQDLKAARLAKIEAAKTTFQSIKPIKAERSPLVVAGVTLG